MTQILKGTTQNANHAGALKLKSVLLTADDAADSVLSVFRYGFVSGDPELVVKALQGTTEQVTFSGIDYPDGLVIVPDANSDFYLIEYE